MEFSCTVEEFFEDGLDVTFVDTLAAFLDISTDRIKIVGIREVETSASRRVLKNNEDSENLFYGSRLLDGEDETNVEVITVISDGESISSEEDGYDP
jgi:hypothetical protein